MHSKYISDKKEWKIIITNLQNRSSKFLGISQILSIILKFNKKNFGTSQNYSCFFHKYFKYNKNII